MDKDEITDAVQHWCRGCGNPLSNTRWRHTSRTEKVLNDFLLSGRSVACGIATAHPEERRSVDAKRKGNRNEHRSMVILKTAGYATTHAIAVSRGNTTASKV